MKSRLLHHSQKTQPCLPGWALILLAIAAMAWLPGRGAAAPVSAEEARAVAAGWLTDLTGTTHTARAVREAAKSSATAGANNYYVVNTQPAGFAVVSGDDAVQPVLFYSDSGELDSRPLPEQLRFLLTETGKTIEKLRADKSEATTQTKTLWRKLRAPVTASGTKAAARSASKDVSPMVTFNWDQGQYYNADCPADSSSEYDGHVLVGCVAVAIGQIMAYHQWPTRGQGSHSYVAGSYGTLSVNFGAQTYNWGAMASSLTTYNDEVAKFLYHCGVAVNMDYGVDSSGAYSDAAAAALINYFRYDSSTVKLVERSSYSDTQWLSMLRTELDAKRPLYYAGSDLTYYVGHAFVFDGYQGTNYFHVNWGWGGYANGYFYLSSLGSTVGYNFSYGQEAIIGIAPLNGSASSVSGYVKSSATGKAILGAAVTVTDPAGASSSATTDATGFWGPVTVNGTGTVSVAAAASGYVSRTVTSTITAVGNDVAIDVSLTPKNQTCQLRVTLAPQAAIDGGAQWRRAGSATWLNSGVMEIDVPNGQYTLEFKSVAGWNFPSETTVNLDGGATVRLTATYLVPPKVGQLKVTITPDAAAQLGAKWRRASTSNWLGGGATEQDVPIGSCTVEFKDVDGWIKPVALPASVSLSNLTELSAQYTQKNAVRPGSWALYY